MKDSGFIWALVLLVGGYFVWKSLGSPNYSENLIKNVLPPGAVQ